MDVATGRVLLGAATVRFEDGLGRRYQADGPAGELLEVLVLRDELSAAPGFDEALRQQMKRLAAFKHPSFSHVRGIARVARSESGIAIISDRVKGVRLSDLLAAAEKRPLPLDMPTALWMTRQLVSAVATLHESVSDVCHGAIAPHRIIITPDARLIVVEHVLGAALPLLQWSLHQYWRELQIGLPSAQGAPAFNRQSDVTQVAAVALALMLGRPLGDECSPRMGASIEGMPDGIRAWMSRALQRDSEQPFPSAVAAREEFECALEDVDAAGGADAAKAFIAAYHANPTLQGTPQERSDSVHREIARPEPTSAPPAAAKVGAQERLMPDRLTPQRRRLIAAAASVLVIASGGAFATHRYFHAPAAVAAMTGTLVVNTVPPGAAIAVDGENRGTSPLRLELIPGNHVLDIVTGTDRRSIPVTITASSQVEQFIEMPKATMAATGQLQIRTEPSGARVIVDGQPRGASPMTIDGLAPRTYTVTLEGELGSVTQDVTIQAGATASLIVPLTAPRGAPVSGWIAISAPAEVQVYENHRLLGSSRLDRIMLSVGRHDLEIVNEALGFRTTRAVNVTPGQLATVAFEWPKGSMALNAIPWADVWIDEERVGETPLGNVLVPIGSHEVVFRHPELGEQRHSVVVTLAAPARVSADMRKR